MESTSNSGNLDFNAFNVWIADTTKLTGDDFSDASDVLTQHNIANGVAENATLGADILFTLEGATNGKTGLYYFKNNVGGGGIDTGDQLAVLAVLDTVDLTTAEFVAG